jgi:predicted adenine nucleotide alpha hydrolase (AANH) superfamily ATPase
VKETRQQDVPTNVLSNQSDHVAKRFHGNTRAGERTPLVADIVELFVQKYCGTFFSSKKTTATLAQFALSQAQNLTVIK